MVSPINSNFNFNETVSQLYTANSTAKLVKTTVESYIKANPNTKITPSNFIDYNDDDSEKSINDILKDYTKNTADYIKKLQNQSSGNSLTRTDYQDVGMSGYYDAQSALQMSKAITAYSVNKASANNTPTNTFNIGV